MNGTAAQSVDRYYRTSAAQLGDTTNNGLESTASGSPEPVDGGFDATHLLIKPLWASPRVP